MKESNNSLETSASFLSDQKIEAAQKAARGKEGADVNLAQNSDTGTVFQRLRVWLDLRRQQVVSKVEETESEPVSEPAWPRHWAITKYL